MLIVTKADDFEMGGINTFKWSAMTVKTHLTKTMQSGNTR